MIALFTPALTCLCSVLLLVFVPSIRDAATPLLPYFPWLVLLSGLFLSWRFNRSRLAYTLLVLACSGAVLHFPDQTRLLHPDLWLPGILPLALLVVMILPEKGFLTPGGLMRPVFLGLLYAAGALAGALAPEWFRSLENVNLLPSSLLGVLLPASHVALIIVFCLLVSTWWCWRRPEPLEAGLLASQVFAIPALHAGFSLPAPAWLGFAGLAPTLAIIEMSLQMAFRDELTGLRGRRALNENLQRLGSRYCVAMLDIDHFKKFNDRHGHDVGDQVLRMVAGKLAKVGGGGRPFRYGGEEFAILFTGRSLEECRNWLEELRQEIEQARFTIRRRYRRPKNKPQAPKPANRHNRQLRVTISIGLAQKQKNMSPETVLKAADKALYRAKKGGRNRVCD